MVGKEYKVPEANINDISLMESRVKSTKTALAYFSQNLRREYDQLWATLDELIPEIDSDSYDYLLENNTVRCIGKRHV